MKREFKAYIPKIPLNKEFTGFGQNIFVGRFGYPNVNLGYLSSEKRSLLQDSPSVWAKKGFSIDDVMNQRMGILNSTVSVNVKSLQGRKEEDARLLAQSVNNPKIDISLIRAPLAKVHLDSFAPPFGGAAKLQNLRIDENPKIPVKIVKKVADTDLRVSDAFRELGFRKFDEHYLSSLLSSGSLGLKSERKMVPTRWSITATDDTLAKIYLNEIKHFEFSPASMFQGGHLGNYYIIFFLPGSFSYELFEIELERGTVWHDYELETGRKSYVKETAGGYYASRLGVLEYMKTNKIQARVLVFRYVTEEYYQHLGVWVVREAVRNAMKSEKQLIQETELSNLLIRNSKRFGYYPGLLLQKSVLLREGKQKRLFNY